MLQPTQKERVARLKARLRADLEKAREQGQTDAERAHAFLKRHALKVSTGFLIALNLLMLYGIIQALS